MEFLKKPWAHQLAGIARAENLDNFALFWEMGTGKTGAAINMLRHKFNVNKRFLKTLIITPPIVIKNWQDEFQIHSKISLENITLLYGPGPRRLKLFLKNGFTSTQEPKGHVFITNYEALLMPDLYEALQAWGPEILIVDESHRVKDPTAKRSKLLRKLANGEGKYLPIAYRYILTGTPILNSPMDLFSQFLILDGGETFGDNFYAFRATYFYDKNAGMPRHLYFPDWQIIPGSLDKIASKMAHKSMRVEKKDCLDLPPLIRQAIKVGMTADQSRMYSEMKKDFITTLENPRGETDTAIATLAMTKALRLMQIASGFIKTVDKKVVSLGLTPKQEALKELLENIAPNHKVIVWCAWKENYEQVRRICHELGLEYVELTGETSPSDRFENIERFTHDPACRVFIGNAGSGGIGINLVVASVSIIYSRNFSLEHFLQSEARNYRGGSEIHAKIIQYNLVCENTIDELILNALDNKIEISDKVLRSEMLLGIKNQLNGE